MLTFDLDYLEDALNASSKVSSPSSIVNQKEGLIIFTSYLTEPELA